MSTIQEHIDAALAMGFHSLGFSGHGYVPYEGLFSGMSPKGTAEYLDTISSAKEKYAGRLRIYAGLENDSAYMHPAGGYDYTIGSVHCIKCWDNYFSIDSSAAIASRTVAEEFCGDGLAYAEAYYKAVLEFVSVKRADILGHIDLVRRFNTVDNQDESSGNCVYRFFDEGCAGYRRAAEAALEQAVRSGYIVEINTSPIYKGFSDEPYPSGYLLALAGELGARVIVSSDAHYAANLNYAFDRIEATLRDFGFKERWELAPDGFQPVRLK